MVIDSHHHLWQRREPFDYSWLESPELKPINRDFLPDDLKPLIQQVDVDCTIVVQTQHDVRENDWALGLADKHEFIAGVVGWVDLASEECEDQLLKFCEHPKAVGIRHVTQDEPNDDYIVQPDILRGLKTLQKHGVPFDLLFYVKHLNHAQTLAAELPDLPMVIDHLSKPVIKEQRFDTWLDDFRAASRFPNIYCKLSGMITEADWQNWSPKDLKPYVGYALDFFGPERCMFGSDWPVCLLAGSYVDVKGALEELTGDLSVTEKEAIFGKTAANFYRLNN
ncbi:amidohydrolase family protein [Calycomorphotria hydatis]|uniref:Amidohydrolase n=1 Tax=Calycomorphotria hydatis TaxID=2528027 RepID=A0A517TAT3_9PLAN|nr:amidohydrolase family protein [Calycomorphotria hydatis]QDT65483.1 Amidohydrolase [Calycomorphotria hydatis]